MVLSEKKVKKNWFSTGEEEVPWEQWCNVYPLQKCQPLLTALRRVINAELRQPKTDRDRQAFQADIASTLTKAIETMITYTSSDRGRAVVPPITDAKGISPFPFKVTVTIGNLEVG